MTFFGVIGDPEFFESSIPYTVDVMLTLDLSEQRIIEFEQKPDFYSDLDPTSPSDEYNDDMTGMLIFRRAVYDQHTIMGLITEKSMDDDDETRGLSSFFGSNPVVSVLLLLILISISIGAGYLISASRVDGPKLLNQEDEEIIQAELLD